MAQKNNSEPEIIDIKKYVKKTEVAKKLRERIIQERFYLFIGMGGTVATYLAIIFAGIWGGILPIGIVAVLGYLRYMKLDKGLKYLDSNYSEKEEQKPAEEFI